MSVCDSIPNIEESAFLKGAYVGYCHGAQLITKWGTGWITGRLLSSAGTVIQPPIKARTLKEMGEKLAKLKEDLCLISE